MTEQRRIPLGIGILRRRRLGEPVDVTTQKTFKFFPRNPPRKGEIVLVDDQRCRVTRCKVRWEGCQWTLLDLWVKPAPAERRIRTGDGCA